MVVQPATALPGSSRRRPPCRDHPVGAIRRGDSCRPGSGGNSVAGAERIQQIFWDPGHVSDHTLQVVRNFPDVIAVKLNIQDLPNKHDDDGL